MERYNIDIVPHCYGEPPSIQANADGKWVYADDARLEIAKRDDIIKRMARGLEDFNVEYNDESTREMIAEAEAMT